MANTLVGLFDDRTAAEGAVQDLISAGISRDKISVVANDASGNFQTESVDGDGNLAAEGASAGISSGAVVGGIAGLLIGAGFTVLPIAGLLLAGPIAGLLAGAATGAATGGVIGGLIGLGIPQGHAEVYAESVRRGGTLVTVQADAGDEARIRDILDRDGAVDIEERGSYYRSSGFDLYDATAKPFNETEIQAERANYTAPATNLNTNTNYAASAPASDKIEVVEEQIQVGKREVEAGGVRVRSFVTEKPVTEQVTLREEHVEVHRTPVDRPVSGADNLFREESIELRETAEVPVVAKEARVVEEISLDKTVNERTETIQDTVRRTDVEIENVGDADWNSRFRSHFATSGSTGTYEEYAPAYDYGRQIASSESYADDFDTNDVYRAQWESKYPGTWDRFKGNIRHAANEVRGGSSTRSNSANLF